MSDEHFLRRAFALARETKAAGAGAPFGCVIVKDGQVVGEGANRVTAECDPTWHSEMAAIRAACHKLQTPDLTGCVLYASGEPCPMCAAAIHFARLDRVVFGAAGDDEARWAGYRYGFTPEQAALPSLERALPTTQLLADEAP